MGVIYITKITKRKHPNIIRAANSGRMLIKDAVPITTLYDVTYERTSKSIGGSFKIIGKFISLKKAMEAAKEFGLKKLHTRDPEIEVDPAIKQSEFK